MRSLAEPAIYARSSLPKRKSYAWPNQARLAFAVVVSMETYEIEPPPGSFMPSNVPGMFGRGPYPDIGSFSRREYGNRVGVFRVMNSLQRHAIPATAAIDARTAEACPFIVQECRRLGWEIAAHGIAVTQVISSLMTEDQERSYIAETLNTLAAAGISPNGWHGPENGESVRTPELLTGHGLTYVLDWPNDEQPFTMTTKSGSLTSLSMSLELDDCYALWHRKLSLETWRDAVIASINELLRSDVGGRMLILNLHPWLIGHPFRIGYLDEILDHVRAQSGIWFATAGELSSWHASGSWQN